MTPSFLEQVAAQPREQIEAELQAVRHQRDLLEVQEEFLRAALRLKLEMDDDLPEPPEEDDEPEAEPPAPEIGTNGNVSIISAVEETVNTDGDGRWLGTAYIRTRLNSRGIPATPNAVRVALRRLTLRGRIERHPTDPRYRRLSQDLTLPTGGHQE